MIDSDSDESCIQTDFDPDIDRDDGVGDSDNNVEVSALGTKPQLNRELAACATRNCTYCAITE